MSLYACTMVCLSTHLKKSWVAFSFIDYCNYSLITIVIIAIVINVQNGISDVM